MVKDFYPCDIKELEKILDENKYFEKKTNTWKKIIHEKYCTHVTRKGLLCLTKIKNIDNNYCKHHLKKDYFILCSYNNCKNKCKVFGDLCHKHNKYEHNNINIIEDTIFNYNISIKNNFNYENIIKKEDLLNKKITIIEYKTYNYCNGNKPIVKYFDYKKYINKILFNNFKQIYYYCIKYKIDLHYLLCILKIFYNFYQSSYFKKFCKNKNYEHYINKNAYFVEIPMNLNKNNMQIIKYNDNSLEQFNKFMYNKYKIYLKNKKNRKKNKSIDQLYNIFNDKIKNYVSYGKTKIYSKKLKGIINNNLNKYKYKYKDNNNLFIYDSSVVIYREINKYIEKEIYHDLDFFNKLMRNVFIYYKIFALIVDGDTNKEEKEKWKSRLEDYIFSTLKNF